MERKGKEMKRQTEEERLKHIKEVKKKKKNLSQEAIDLIKSNKGFYQILHKEKTIKLSFSSVVMVLEIGFLDLPSDKQVLYLNQMALKIRKEIKEGKKKGVM